MELELRINGMVADQDVAPNEPLISLLRRKGYTSVKRGCETGECGACTVLVDGVARPSCVMLAAQVGGCTLTTVESLSSGDKLHALQTAFIETGATPCGFCTPGMLLSAQALLRDTPAPTEEEVREALSGNLCRCSSYDRPVQAVLRAAAALRAEEVEPLTYNMLKAEDEDGPNIGRMGMLGASEKLRAIVSNGASSTVTTKISAVSTLTTPVPAISAAPAESLPFDAQLKIVGKSIPDLNARKAATGRANFVADIQFQGMLYGRILTSPHAHAIIRDIDVTKAKTLPGVHAVLTYRDVPRIPHTRVERSQDGIDVQDQYSLDYIVRYVGDRVAAVVAETAEVAEIALGLIEVDYQVLPSILDTRQASDSKAPRIHPEGESQGILDAARNIAARTRSDIGDVEQGFAASDHVLEAEYVMPATQQATLETHTAVTYLDEDGVLVVHTNSTAPHHIRHTLAHTLAIPVRRIRAVTSNATGRARQEMVLEDICALLTMATRRPVKLEYSRAEEFRTGSVQPRAILRLKTGVRQDGTILANQMVLLTDTGAYATQSQFAVQNIAHALALYPCPNMRFVAEMLYTNHPPTGAAYGYELAPAFFALESHIDDVARRLGMDALALRRKNWLKAGDTYPIPHNSDGSRDTHPKVESCGLPTCLQVVEEKLAWAEKRGRANYDRFRRGVGIALSFQGNPGPSQGTSGAIIKLNEDGSFDVFASGSDNGMGTMTLIAQVAAEVLGVAIDEVRVHTSDTDSTPFETNVNDFSTFYSSGGAVKRAAEQIRRQVLSVAGRMLNAMPESLKMNNGIIRAAQGSAQVSLAEVATHSLYVENRQVMTTSSWKMNFLPMTFAAQGVEVEVDFETGAVRVLKAISAVDVGNPINPMLLEGQIQDATTQALSMSLCEEIVYDQNGAMLTTNFQDYHIFTTNDVPEIQTYLIETNDSSELFGAKSVATIPLYGMAPAIANAILDAADIRLRQLPLSPERVLRALHAQMARR